MDDILESYRILDIGPNASLEEVKRAYRELARVWHPDRFPNDVLLHQKAQEKLKQINIAYERIYGRGTHEPRRPTTSTRQSTSQQTRQSAPPPQWTPPQSQTSQSAPAKPKSTSWFWGPERSRVLWIWIFGVLAALYNPIFRVHLDRTTWIGVNWFTAGVIAVAAVVFWWRPMRNAHSAAKKNDSRPNLNFIKPRAALSVLVFAVLASAAFVGYRIYDNHARSEANYARSEEFLKDVLSLIRGLYDMRGETQPGVMPERSPDDSPFEEAYRIKQNVIDARRILSPWLADSQPDRQRIVEAANVALTEFERAADVFMELSHNRGNKQHGDEQLAEFKVKIDSGRLKILEITDPIRNLSLTAESKKRLTQYIDNSFGAQLDAQRKSKGGPNEMFELEIIAVEVIRNQLQPSPKPMKELFHWMKAP